MSRHPRIVVMFALITVIILTAVLVLVYDSDDGEDDVHKRNPDPAASAQALKHLLAQYIVSTASNPARTILSDRSGNRVAVLTTGARSVVLRGPERTMTEPATTAARIVTRDWVRLAPQPYPGTLNALWASWLDSLIGDTADDLLAVAQQYSGGVPVRRDENGVAYAGDASFGYQRDGDSRDGADFYEYLGVPWRFPDGEKVLPDENWAGALDCSGYIRLVFGYRMGMALHRGNGIVDGLPRSAWAMADHAPSVLIATAKTPSSVPTDLSRLQSGDVVFFALHDNEADQISHSGIYLGIDHQGRRRFISSRSTVNGPTFGDKGGLGIIDGGYFGDRLRRIIRL